MKNIKLKLIVALLTFAFGVTITVLWVAPRFHSAIKHRDSERSATDQRNEVAPPEGWKPIEVRNKVMMYIPRDMEPSNVLGDSDSYRVAFKNGEIRITIIYEQADACAVPQQLTERSAYKESVVEVGGAKGKLGIERDFEPGTSVAYFCVPVKGDSTAQLRLSAICKSNRALEIAREIFAAIRFKDR